jgi:hypothetical protein
MKLFGKKAAAKASKASSKKEASKSSGNENKSSKDPENVNASEMSTSTSIDSTSQFSKTLSTLASFFSIEVGLAGDKGVDVKHTLPATKQEQEEKKRKRIIFALIAAFLALIIFLVVFFLTRGDSTTQSGPPRSRLGVLEGILGLDVTPLDVLRDNTTAQHEAIMWFAFDDPTYPDLESLSDDLIIARYVSALLYFSTNGPGWRQQLNFMSDAPICEWNDGGTGNVEEGIVCDSDDAGRVDGIVVDLNSLEGTLPTELAVLPYLKDLGFGTSLETYQIMNFVGLLSNIYLFIHSASNRFTGTIPTEYGLMTNLVFFSVSGNSLTGTLPTELSNMKKLEAFRVHWNQLTGKVPGVYNQMSSLRTVHLEGNDFTGNLETSLCGLPDQFEAFMSDCASSTGDDGEADVISEITCFCCTHCCFDGGGCRPIEWFNV